MKYLVKINVQDPELEITLNDAANDYFVPIHMFRNQTTQSGVETTTIVFLQKKPQTFAYQQPVIVPFQSPVSPL